MSYSKFSDQKKCRQVNKNPAFVSQFLLARAVNDKK